MLMMMTWMRGCRFERDARIIINIESVTYCIICHGTSSRSFHKKFYHICFANTIRCWGSFIDFFIDKGILEMVSLETEQVGMMECRFD